MPYLARGGVGNEVEKEGFGAVPDASGGPMESTSQEGGSHAIGPRLVVVRSGIAGAGVAEQYQAISPGFT